MPVGPQSELLAHIAVARQQLRRRSTRSGPSAWTPQPGPQSEFYRSDVYEILYGGAAGGGKSAALVAYPLRWSHLPESRSLILRRNTPQLEDLLEKARQIYKTGKEGRFCGYESEAEFRGDKGIYTFRSGAKVRFGHCNDTNDWLNYQGHEYPCICFDELTHFTERQYLEICKRCRGGSTRTPKLIRSTTNPGGPGHGWVFKRWKYWLDPEATIPGRPPRFDEHGKKLPPARPGEVLWFYTDKDGTERLVEPGTPEARSRTFIPARLEDNPALIDEDPEYRQRLRDDSDPVRRKQLEDGDWLIRPAAGLYFRREMFVFVDELPLVARWVRSWDFAATPEDGSNDPDWTRGLKIGKTKDGLLWVADLASLRGAPGDVENFLKATAELDGKSVTVRIPQDPAAAGKIVASYYTRLLLGWPVSVKRVVGDKMTRAKIAQGQAQAGNIRIKRGPWNEAFIQELEGFPDEEYHDDIVDALSDGVDELGVAVASGDGKSAGHREFGGSQERALDRVERRFGGGSRAGF